MSSIATGSTGRPFLTVAEAADELAVTERFIRKLIAEGDLRAVKVGARVVRTLRPSASTHPSPRGTRFRRRPTISAIRWSS